VPPVDEKERGRRVAPPHRTSRSRTRRATRPANDTHAGHTHSGARTRTHPAFLTPFPGELPRDASPAWCPPARPLKDARGDARVTHARAAQPTLERRSSVQSPTELKLARCCQHLRPAFYRNSTGAGTAILIEPGRPRGAGPITTAPTGRRLQGTAPAGRSVAPASTDTRRPAWAVAHDHSVTKFGIDNGLHGPRSRHRTRPGHHGRGRGAAPWVRNVRAAGNRQTGCRYLPDVRYRMWKASERAPHPWRGRAD
jgi:hypothetical protein